MCHASKTSRIGAPVNYKAFEYTSFAWFLRRFVLAMIKTKGCLKKATATSKRKSLIYHAMKNMTRTNYFASPNHTAKQQS